VLEAVVSASADSAQSSFWVAWSVMALGLGLPLALDYRNFALRMSDRMNARTPGGLGVGVDPT
jgi:hypothetical protein